MSRIILIIVACSMLAISCSTSKDANAPHIPKSLADKLMIELVQGVDPDEFAESFNNYDLKKKYLASKSQNLHMFTFDTATIEIRSLVKKISKDKRVVSVEVLSDQLNTPTMEQSAPKKSVEIK